MRRIGVPSIFLGMMVAVGVACGGDGAGPPPNLDGTWQATKVEFISVANPNLKVDLVAQGATVTLVLNPGGTYQQTTKVTGQPDDVTTGTWSATADVLTITETGMPFSIQFNLSLSGNILTLTGGDTEFDFDQNGIDEAAKLNVTMVR